MFRFRPRSFRARLLLLPLLVLVLILIVVGCASFVTPAASTAPTLTADLSLINESMTNRADLLALTTAQVNANAAAAPSMLPVVGWYGQLLDATPNGAYRFQLATPTGQGPTLTVTGANPVLNYRLSTMQAPDSGRPDPNNPARWGHIWGTMLCNTAEFDGCQVRVSRLRRNTGDQVVTVDTVDGWEGSLEAVWNEAGEVIGDQFVLAGDYPAQFGVEAAFADTTGQDLTARLAGLRDSGRLVRVSGALTCGVSDVNGCRIAVSNIISLPRSAEPERITHEVVDGLSGVIVMNDVNAPYPVGFQFETSDHIVGVVSSDAFVQAQLQELMSASKDNFPTTVRIWGMIYYHDTANLADDLITITALEGPVGG